MSRVLGIVKDYLERAGYRVALAANGADALALAGARRPDLIVLDLGLPGMDASTSREDCARSRACPSSC